MAVAVKRLFSLLFYLDIHGLSGLQVFRHLNGVAFFSSESETVRVFAGKIFKRHNTHSHQIAAVDSLKTLRYHGLDALERTQNRIIGQKKKNIEEHLVTLQLVCCTTAAFVSRF